MDEDEDDEDEGCVASTGAGVVSTEATSWSGSSSGGEVDENDWLDWLTRAAGAPFSDWRCGLNMGTTSGAFALNSCLMVFI